MNHEEWLEWRRQGIGSSDAPVIMGISPFKTLAQLRRDKLYGEQQEDNPYMKRGRDLEPVARAAFIELMGIEVVPSYLVHMDYPWMRASLDGVCNENKFLVEIKCPSNPKDHETAKLGIVPDKYYYQCLHQLFVTGYKKMFYWSFDGKDGIAIEVIWNEDSIETYFQEAQEFWNSIQETIRFEANAEWEKHVKGYLNKARIRDEVIEGMENHKKALKALSGDKNAYGSGFEMVKTECKGQINYKTAINEYVEKLKALYPDLILPSIDFEEYRLEPFIKWSIHDI